MKSYRTVSAKLNPLTSSSVEPPKKERSEIVSLKYQVLIRVPGCKVHLMDEGEALQVADGDFVMAVVSSDGVALATVVKVGGRFQWPLTKDGPVVKIDGSHYVFSLPMRDGSPLNYGVSFNGKKGATMEPLDRLLKQHSCFSDLTKSTGGRGKEILNWEEFAPRINAYNNVLAKAIAEGTGQIVKGIFNISNSYAAQVQKGVEMVATDAGETNNGVSRGRNTSKRMTNDRENGGKSSTSLKRARKLSEATENLSKSMLSGVNNAKGTVAKPVIQSEVMKAFLATAPGEVLLASIDAINSILDAAEAAEKEAMYATSTATTSMVTGRFGESAGEASEDVLATVGHCAGTAWNVFKIRKAVIPSSAAKNSPKP